MRRTFMISPSGRWSAVTRHLVERERVALVGVLGSRDVLAWEMHPADGDVWRQLLGPFDGRLVDRHRMEVRAELDLKVEIETHALCSSSASVGPNTSGPLVRSISRWIACAALSAVGATRIWRRGRRDVRRPSSSTCSAADCAPASAPLSRRRTSRPTPSPTARGRGSWRPAGTAGSWRRRSGPVHRCATEELPGTRDRGRRRGGAPFRSSTSSKGMR